MATRSRANKKAIQAVLLADSFMHPHRFRPMTHSMPKVLLPLVNVPMLEYTLEFLSTSNVDDIIIFASSHAEQIQNYIQGTRWLHKQPELKVSVVVSTESRSVGDALRYLDQTDAIKNDFILVTGDVISNIDLNPIILEHRKKSAENPEITLTMLFTTVQPGHAMRSRTDDLMVATDRSSNRIIHYSNDIQQGLVKLHSKTLLSAPNGVNIQTNAFDTGILICNKRLVNILAEQFDFKCIREDYIAQQLNFGSESVISESGITFDHIHAHFVPPGAYANRIVDMRTYHTCSHDIIRKWLSPIVISNNILAKTSYKSFPNNVYREDKVSLSHTTLLKADCVVGRLSKFGLSTMLHKTIIGRNVTVGNSCSLTTCYVLDGTTIGNDCVMNGAFVGKGVKIGNNVTIHKGAVIDNNVVIGDNVIIPPYVSITADEQLDDEESEALKVEKMRITAIHKSGNYVDISTIFDITGSDDDAPPTKLNPDQRDSLDAFPIDPRTFFYNNETEAELAHRKAKMNKTTINFSGFDEDQIPHRELTLHPRIMLPSIEILQLNSSPHQVFSKQTMPQILQEWKDANQEFTTPPDSDDELGPLRSQQQQQHQSSQRTSSMMIYNQADVAKNFSPYTNKGYEALLSSNQRTKQQGSPQSTMDGSLTMLSPSTLQQTLMRNDEDTTRALSQKLPYYPLADLTTLHKMDSALVVGQGGKGRLYLHPPHRQFGRAIVLLNSTAPPPYIFSQNYEPLRMKNVIAETIEYDAYDDCDDYIPGHGESDEDEDDVISETELNFANSEEDIDDDDGRSTVSRVTIKMPAQATPTADTMANDKTLQGARAFVGEVISSMKRSLQGEKVANIIQELPTLRLVYRDVGYDVYIAAVFLGIFSMANLEAPNKGLYKDADKPAWEPTGAESKAAVIVALFKLWAPTLRPASAGDALSLILPALTTACLLNNSYARLYPALLNELYHIDYVSADDVISYHSHVKTLTTLHTTRKSLLPSMVDYVDSVGSNIQGLDKLTKILENIIELLQDDDEDEDEDEDE